ncbi:Protein of unknown function [Pyronema omphalodes CBS 100304]|uniref:Uncharacterized protein n=1 Tax=Pyronema omphalodes (strain CBS 100304) TaxID=1076935 RepID=U4L8X1_PYROM|nr:Protein of unknown function [Pyronema omphalodes CBS 100304]
MELRFQIGPLHSHRSKLCIKNYSFEGPKPTVNSVVLWHTYPFLSNNPRSLDTSECSITNGHQLLCQMHFNSMYGGFERSMQRPRAQLKI